MRHPSLGAPPPDLTRGYPDGARRLRSAMPRLAVRALEVALEQDPTMRDRLGELGLRKLLRDAETFIDRVALAVAANDPHFTTAWAEFLAPTYRRRRVPMDDLIRLCEGIRAATGSVLDPAETIAAGKALDEAIRVFRGHRRIAGDARKRNRIITFLYKGA